MIWEKCPWCWLVGVSHRPLHFAHVGVQAAVPPLCTESVPQKGAEPCCLVSRWNPFVFGSRLGKWFCLPSLCLEKAGLEVKPSFPQLEAANPEGCGNLCAKPPGSWRCFLQQPQSSGLAESTRERKSQGFEGHGGAGSGTEHSEESGVSSVDRGAG